MVGALNRAHVLENSEITPFWELSYPSCRGLPTGDVDLLPAGGHGTGLRPHLACRPAPTEVHSPPPARRRQGEGGRSTERLSEHLVRIRDTCSIYAVRSGGRVLLIDCGTHFAPRDEAAAHLGAVEQILLTHYHRDQCGSAVAWQREGTRLVLPHVERRLAEEADLARAAYDIYNNYTSYYPGFGPSVDVNAFGYARDYETWSWDQYQFEVIPLPGHTYGSVGYLFEVDGRRLLACGDLLCDPGHLRDYFWTQWQYMDFQGHVNLIESLEVVDDLEVDLILPGHGEAFAPDRQKLSGLRDRLVEIWERFHGEAYTPYRPQFRTLSEHVYEVTNTSARTYLVTDGDGHALCIDCGYASGAPIAANPHRFIDRVTPHLESELGIRQVEYLIPSHYHDDHVAGYPALRARYGAQLVASRATCDLLQHPERYDMPCLLPEGVSVSSSLAPGEPFEWRGLHFAVDPGPGQTMYDELIAFEVDHRKYVAIGDCISGLSLNADRDHIHSFIPKNRTPLSAYSQIPRRVMAHQPDVLLTGHGGAIAAEAGSMLRWTRWMERWQELFTEIVDRPHPDQAMDPRWVEFYPYKVQVQPGEERFFHLWITNHEAQPRSCQVTFRSLEGMAVAPEQVSLTVAPAAREVVEVQVRFPEVFSTHSLPVLADVVWDGVSLGEIAEAIAYW
ncbi:MBL fold metallo-hydrolase [Candidatus Latescibacterota bacterium]